MMWSDVAPHHDAFMNSSILHQCAAVPHGLHRLGDSATKLDANRQLEYGSRTQQVQRVHGPCGKGQLQDCAADDVGLRQRVRQRQDDLADLHRSTGVCQ